MFKVSNKETIVVILMSLLLTSTYFTPCYSISIFNFEQVNTTWVRKIDMNMDVKISSVIKKLK